MRWNHKIRIGNSTNWMNSIPSKQMTNRSNNKKYDSGKLLSWTKSWICRLKRAHCVFDKD